MILDYLDGEAAAALFTELHGDELDAIVNDVTDRLRRLDAEGRLDAESVAAAEAEILRRVTALGQTFLMSYLDAAAAADAAVTEARPKPLRKWLRPRRCTKKVLR